MYEKYKIKLATDSGDLVFGREQVMFFPEKGGGGGGGGFINLHTAYSCLHCLLPFLPLNVPTLASILPIPATRRHQSRALINQAIQV